MKKFFTSIPLRPPGGLKSYIYQAMGNDRLQLDRPISFPILCAIHGYVRAGEDFRVIAIVEESDNGRYNYRLFQEQLHEVCGIDNPKSKIEEIWITTEQQVSVQTETFLRLIEKVDDGDELFACITYGTKPQSITVRMALQYAYRVKQNVTFSGILYGNVLRPDPDCSSWRAEVYDETALVQLDEIVRLLAERRVRDPERALRNILTL